MDEIKYVEWNMIYESDNCITLDYNNRSYVEWKDRKTIYLNEEKYEKFNDETNPFGYYFIKNHQMRTRKSIRELGIITGVSEFTEWIDRHYICDSCQKESSIVATLDDVEYYKKVRLYCIDCLDTEIDKLKILKNKVIESEVKRISEEVKLLRNKNGSETK